MSEGDPSRISGNIVTPFVVNGAVIAELGEAFRYATVGAQVWNPDRAQQEAVNNYATLGMGLLNALSQSAPDSVCDPRSIALLSEDCIAIDARLRYAGPDNRLSPGENTMVMQRFIADAAHAMWTQRVTRDNFSSYHRLTRRAFNLVAQGFEMVGDIAVPSDSHFAAQIADILEQSRQTTAVFHAERLEQLSGTFLDAQQGPPEGLRRYSYEPGSSVAVDLASVKPLLESTQSRAAFYEEGRPTLGATAVTRFPGRALLMFRAGENSFMIVERGRHTHAKAPSNFRSNETPHQIEVLQLSGNQDPRFGIQVYERTYDLEVGGPQEVHDVAPEGYRRTDGERSTGVTLAINSKGQLVLRTDVPMRIIAMEGTLQENLLAAHEVLTHQAEEIGKRLEAADQIAPGYGIDWAASLRSSLGRAVVRRALEDPAGLTGEILIEAHSNFVNPAEWEGNGRARMDGLRNYLTHMRLPQREDLVRHIQDHIQSQARRPLAERVTYIDFGTNIPGVRNRIYYGTDERLSLHVRSIRPAIVIDPTVSVEAP